MSMSGGMSLSSPDQVLSPVQKQGRHGGGRHVLSCRPPPAEAGRQRAARHNRWKEVSHMYAAVGSGALQARKGKWEGT